MSDRARSRGKKTVQCTHCALVSCRQAPNVASEEVALAAATALPETFGSFSGRMVSVVLGGGGSPSKPVKNYDSTRIFRCSLKAPTLMCWRQKIVLFKMNCNYEEWGCDEYSDFRYSNTFESVCIYFLDTQVFLAPTHVRLYVSK